MFPLASSLNTKRDRENPHELSKKKFKKSSRISIPKVLDLFVATNTRTYQLILSHQTIVIDLSEIK